MLELKNCPKKKSFSKRARLRCFITKFLSQLKERFTQVKIVLWIFITSVCMLFLISKNKILQRNKSIQNKKLRKLLLRNFILIFETLHDHEKSTFSSSSQELSREEKSLLCKGLNFSIPPKTFKLCRLHVTCRMFVYFISILQL